MINISIATSSAVTLSIFNLLGQEVSVLYRGQLKAGNHTFPWNAGNLSGGIYFCHMKADEFSKSLKLVLLK
jgi:hypothetical protein